jgi:hypothetical protein
MIWEHFTEWHRQYDQALVTLRFSSRDPTQVSRRMLVKHAFDEHSC